MKAIILNSTGGVSLTSDGWTTSVLKGCYASTVTAHFLDGQWKLNQMVLCVTDLAKRHTADNIVAHWDSVMNCWDLQNITSITTDGAKDYTKAARAFCKLSLWCCCHRLHLISSKLFDHSQILKNLFTTCKNIVTIWNHSVNFQRDLSNISKVSLKTSNPVRWNSAVKMMERIATNRQALEKLQQKYSLSLFVEQDWVLLELIIKKLSAIVITSKFLEETHTPTVQRVFPLMLQIQIEFDKGTEPLLTDLCIKLKELIAEYFKISTISKTKFSQCSLFITATFLDPRTKSFLFIACDEQRAYYLQKVQQHITKEITELKLAERVTARKRSKNDKQKEAYLFLSEIYHSTETGTDVHRYVQMPACVDDEQFSLLDWWSKRHSEYPILSPGLVVIQLVILCRKTRNYNYQIYVILITKIT